MIESIVLDILLVLVVFLMMAIGAYRGGLREAFSAAGVVLGVLIATEWQTTWGDWLADNTSLSDGGGKFLTAVGIMILVSIAVGYGVGSSFNYHPGPGGRMFGVVLAAGSALVAISYVLTWLREFLFDGDDPEVIQNTYIGQFLDGDAGLVLLVVSVLIVGTSLFGSFVRERDSETDAPFAPIGASVARPHGPEITSELPEKVEPAGVDSRHRTTPVRVRESQHWDDQSGTMPSRKDRLWSNTWPSDAPGIEPERHVRSTSDVRQARERRRGREDQSDGGQES